MSVHVFTSITPNYLAKARVLARSVKRFVPDSIFHLLLVDAIPRDFKPANEPFDSVVGISDLGLARPEQWLFKHTVVEACTGVKGFGLKRLLSRRDCTAVLYLDPDIVVLAPLDGLLAKLRARSILLTPHLTRPEETLEAIQDNEFSVLKHGIYNLGFLGVGNTAEGRLFADWWADRLEQFCYDDIPNGLFTDQRWADLAPAYFKDLEILQEPGYNVCTWNLTHRRVEGNFRTGLTAAGEPLRFYHFSGFDSGAQQSMLNKYGASMPALYELRDWYVAECDRQGQKECEDLAWSYDFFDNGDRITAAHRKRYRERIDLQNAFPNPFATRDINRSYFHWYQASSENRVSRAAIDPTLPEIKASGQRITGRTPMRPADPSFKIYLSLCNSEVSSAAAAIRQVREKAFRAEDLFVLAPENLLDELKAIRAIGDTVVPVCLPGPASEEEAFRAAMTHSGGNWDFVFLTDSVVVPELFDLRLAWTSARMQGVGVVSPISDRSPETALGVGQPLDAVDAIDLACYRYSQFWNSDIATFLADCAYFNRNAVKGFLQSGAPVTASGFSDHLQRYRWPQILADHVYTGNRHPRQTSHMKPAGEPLAALHGRILEAGGADLPGGALEESARRRQLHILHSWGGGLQRWVEDYCEGDHEHDNFILKSVGTWGSFGLELHLFRHLHDSVPLRIWPLSPVIRHTADLHLGYQAALSEIIDSYGIDAVFISSLIGHSLDALDATVPTVMVCHDFYPFCPALNITFGGICRHCTYDDLSRCTEANPHHRFFRNVPPSEWVETRAQFATHVLRRNTPLIAPSPSVPTHYTALMPELEPLFQIIPHGFRTFAGDPAPLDFITGGRLKIVILGSLAQQKGLELFNAIAPDLRSFADLYLVGCGDQGEAFQSMRNVHVIPRYNRDELPGILHSIGPHAGLLLSVVPETFSYTLQELMELGIPPVATRIGSFADFIQDGVTGFLVDPDAAAIVGRLRELDAGREVLERIRAALKARARRSLQQMRDDYEKLLNLPRLSARAYFASEPGAPDRAQMVRSFQLMWRRAGADAGEMESTRCRVAVTGADQTVSLPIPAANKPPVQLRLDLGELAGYLILRRVQLFGATNECLWRWESREGPMRGEKSGIELIGDSREYLLHVSGVDPHWLLPVPKGLEALVAGGRLEVEFRCPPLQAITGGSPERQTPGRREASSERLYQQLAEARTRIADLESSLSWRITRPLRQLWGILLKAPAGRTSRR